MAYFARMRFRVWLCCRQAFCWAMYNGQCLWPVRQADLGLKHSEGTYCCQLQEEAMPAAAPG